MTPLRLSDANVARINDLWGLHYKEDNPEASRCLLCLLDTRFVLTDDGLQRRIAVSFGQNPFTPDMKYGFVPPPIHPDKYVYGIHLVATKNDQLTLYDQWMDGSPGGDDGDIETALVSGEQLLSAISESKYKWHILDRPHKGSSTLQNQVLNEPEVVEAEAF